MTKLSKKYKTALSKYNPEQEYSLEQASALLKQIAFAKFDETVDLAIRLGIDPKQSNQMVRGVATLPHGTGKTVRVLVLTTGEKQEAARNAGADHVGLEDYIEKIEKEGWAEVDVVIASPDVMAKVGRLGKVLGPRGLMPNPKTGTVTNDVAAAVKEVKAGKIDFRNDKTGGIVHVAIGKVSFTPQQIAENALEVIQTVAKLKPAAAKGTYIKSIAISSTMSPSIKIDKKSIPGI